MDNNKESGSSDQLMNFMNKQIDKSSSNKNQNTRVNKTKQALENKKREKEEKEDKELNEAKKDSAFKASRYNQADMKKRGFQDMLILLPFIALGALFLFFLLFKAGPMLKGLISGGLKTAIGG